MPNDPFGSVRTGFSHWGNRLQVAAPRHARRFARHAVDLAVQAGLQNLPQGPIQSTLQDLHGTYKRFRDESEYERDTKRAKTMPRRSSGRRSIRRRTPFRRRFSKRRTAIVRRPRRVLRTLWPNSQLVKMKVVYSATNAGTSGALGNYTVNGIEFTDPFGANSAVQPLGLDQWAALYNKGKAVGCDVIFKLHNKGTTAVMAGITPFAESETIAPTAWEDYGEFPGTVKRMLSPDDDTCSLFKRMNTKRWMRLSNIKDEDEIACSVPHGTPSRDYGIRCWYQSLDKSTTNAVEVIIEVTYVVLLYDRVFPSRSTDA